MRIALVPHPDIPWNITTGAEVKGARGHLAWYLCLPHRHRVAIAIPSDPARRPTPLRQPGSEQSDPGMACA